jgi:hypothetical protein
VATIDVDALNRELAQVQDALLALPADAFAERHELLKRRDELREQAAAVAISADDGKSTADLEAEVAALRRRREELISTRIGFATGKGGSAQGPTSGAWVGLGRAAKDGAGMDQLNARISKIERLLAERATR